MDSMTLKFCLGCGRWLPVAAFYARKRYRISTHYPRCMECVEIKARWGELRRREEAGASAHYSQERDADTYICNRCGERKPRSEFYPPSWTCRACKREQWKRYNATRQAKLKRQQRNAPPIVAEIELPPGHYDDLLMAGGIVLKRTQHQATMPEGRLYVDIWQGTDPATGQLVQGWRWAMYYK